MSSDLTKYSVMTDYQDGVLVAEIFKGIFLQIYDLFTTMEVPENEREQILTELKNHVVSIKSTYKDNDKNLIYQELKKLGMLQLAFKSTAGIHLLPSLNLSVE